jgi:hypothetical protein
MTQWLWQAFVFRAKCVVHALFMMQAGYEVGAHVVLVVAETCPCAVSSCCLLLLLQAGLWNGLRDGLRRDAGGR